jgi:Fe2+ or Zn2+ uptake regulation protein
MDERSISADAEHLRARGYRLTAQRRAIMATLRAAARYCTAAELYARLPAPERGHVSVSSVYRTLEVLAGVGLAQRRAESSGETSFLYCSPRHHHHVICTACGAVQEIALCPGTDLTRRAEQETDFQIKGHTFDFYGRCPHCRVAG